MRVSLCLGCLAWLAHAVPAAEFGQSFQGRGFDPKLFRPTGSVARTVSSDAAGLRITLTEKRGSKIPVGLVARTGVRGDFEITMAFDILQLEKPTAGHGAGVGIYITMVSATKEAAALNRSVEPNGEHVWFCLWASTPVGEQRQYHGKRVATDASSGRLRLVRQGSALSYLVAPGDSHQFEELYQVELGTEDLDLVRFAAENGGSSTVLDVRIKDVSIRADDLGGARPLPEPDYSPLWLAAVGALLLLSGGAILLWRRRAG